MKKAVIIEIIVFLYIILFLYAAGTKLTDYERSVAQIGQSPLLTNMAGFIAWFIPVIEIIISILLIIPRTRLLALYASFGLMTMFTIYVMAILSFSKELPCACGGVLSMLHWRGHLFLNIGFVLLAIVAIVFLKQQGESKTAFSR